mgnify:CR=1 FL=1
MVVAGVMLRVTSAVLVAQGLLLMVQRTTTGPAPPVCVKVEVPLAELLKVPVPPLTTLQAPVPEPGVLPPNDEEMPEVQMVCVPPTVAVVGLARKVITTSSVEAVQGELLIVQRNVYVVPALPVKPDVGLLGVVTVPPAPLTMLHAPVPVVGVLAASVTDDPHTVCAIPASAVVGAGTTVTLVLSVSVVPHQFLAVKV